MPKPNGSNDRTDVMWRKNASPPQPNERRCEGVDINRNFDFLWDYERYFAPAALRVLMNSTHPCDDVYIGPRSLSEPETQNVAWIMDQYPQIRFYVDVHSYSDLILVGWGDDDEQTTDPDMHFRNPEYDGKRGITKESLRPDAANYAEYVLEKDQVLAKNLAKRVQKAMFRVRKRAYTVEQSVTLYPTAGTSTDYAAGRFRINQNNSKVYAFCIECGSGAPDEGFQPTLENRQLIIEEIIAGLLEFCIGVIALDSDS
jgi:murein tripeptide amidase MpaA